MFGKIIVPVDRWRSGLQTARVADELATALKVPLELVSVAMPDAIDMDDREFTLKGIAFDLKAEVERELIVGYGACTRLARHLDHADRPLVVMATTAGGRARDVVLGSFTESLLRRTHTPMILTGPQWRDWEGIVGKPVVVCVDGSAHSEHILAHATQWADQFGAEVTVVAQQEDWTAADRAAGVATGDLLESGYVHSVANAIGAAGFEVLHGASPPDAIADHARETGAGLIMMATHGRTGMARLAMGSVALQTVFKAGCPVFVVRPPDLALEPDEELVAKEVAGGRA